MCHHCVIESVKQRMLSRRDLFKAAPAVAVAAAATGIATPTLAASHSGVADLTHELHHDFPTYFGKPGITLEQVFNFADNGFNLFNITLNEHTGTLLTPDDLKAWTAANGPFPAHCCVALNSGWDKHVNSDKFRGEDADGKQHYPGFHVEAAQMLIEETTAVGIASDTLSLDHGISADFATHYAWLPTNRWGLENVANLDALPAVGATLIVGAPKWRGGSGGPTRVMALV